MKFIFLSQQKQYTKRGFTLIETLIAVFILALTVSSLVVLSSGGYFSIRYIRNQFVANVLTEEVFEYLKHTRDTALQNGTTWIDWQDQYLLANQTPSGNGCFTPAGCVIDPYTSQVIKTTSCSSSCPPIVFYPQKGLYAYETTFTGFTITPTSFEKRVFARTTIDPNQIEILVEVRWLNGTLARTSQQSVLMTNWRP